MIRITEILVTLLTARIVLCMTPVEHQVRLIVLATVGDRFGEIVLQRETLRNKRRFEGISLHDRRMTERYVAEVVLRKI